MLRVIDLSFPKCLKNNIYWNSFNVRFLLLNSRWMWKSAAISLHTHADTYFSRTCTLHHFLGFVLYTDCGTQNARQLHVWKVPTFCRYVVSFDFRYKGVTDWSLVMWVASILSAFCASQFRSFHCFTKLWWLYCPGIVFQIQIFMPRVRFSYVLQ
jgi:hypothetical protein